jgi:protease-4
MKFVGKAWKLLVGIKDALVLLFMLVFFGGLYAALAASPHKDSASRGALRLDLAGSIVEQPRVGSPFAALGGGSAAREYRVSELIHALDVAATDERIQAVALDLDSFAGGGQTAIANVGEALDRVRRAGKKVVAYATGYGDDGYQLAAHADEIWLDPLGAVLIAGPGGSNLYYAGLLERLGITANVYRVGAFKSAVEPYTRSDMSPEAREASQALANALWSSWQQDVRHARPRAQVAQYVADTAGMIQAAGGDMARAALRAGLVDHVGDRTAFGRRMAELAGTDDETVPGSYRAVHLDAWIDDHPASRASGQVAVLTVAGEIVDGNAPAGTAGGDTIARNLERGFESGDIKALVVRVDSPGGSVTGSERIRRAILGARARGIPVVISMGSVAASGGYWIATAGDVIFAEPSTITGSIGVFGILPSFEGSLQKLGIGADGVRTTPLSGEPDLLRGPSPEADRLLQMGVEATYRRFISLVATARHLSPARVNEIGQGRVWDGGTARQLGLVDRFGSLDDAIAEAARRANLDPAGVHPLFLEKKPGWLGQLLSDAASGEDEDEAHAGARDAFARLAHRPEAMIQRALYDARQLLAGPAIQARCLECPAIAPTPSARGRAGAGESLWARLLALVWQG